MLRVELDGWTAVFTGRAEGNLRVSARGPDREPLNAVQTRMLESLGIGGGVVVPAQVHGADVITAEERLPGYRVGAGEGDGVATAFRGMAVGVHVADCLPIGIGGADGVAMLHGGWRGLHAGIVGEGVRVLRELGVRGEVAAVIGPGVGACCYETGDDVRARFASYAAQRGRLLDLKAIATAQLREAGVAEVRDVGLCTICSPAGMFFSHRRDGADTGRQGGFAWID
jgi:polyphenol oxidase